ncbi:hypothetical protein ACQJBY_068985 [Aegilops geniculata]
MANSIGLPSSNSRRKPYPSSHDNRQKAGQMNPSYPLPSSGEERDIHGGRLPDPHRDRACSSRRPMPWTSSSSSLLFFLPITICRSSSSSPPPSTGSTMHHLDLLIQSGAAAATTPSFHVDGGHDLHKELQGDKVIAKNDRDEIHRQE